MEKTEADITTNPEALEEIRLKKASKLCRYCHTFSEIQLLKQSKMARRRHIKVKAEDQHCFGCHDEDELKDIDYHN